MYMNSVLTVLLGQTPYLTELTVVCTAKEPQVRVMGTSRPADRSRQPCLPTLSYSTLEQTGPGHCLPHSRGSRGRGIICQPTYLFPFTGLTQNLHKHTPYQPRAQHVFRSKRLNKRTKLKSSALRGGHSSYLRW